MDMTQIHDYASRLIEIHGDKAEVEAAQKLQEFEAAGDEEEAETWRRIRSVIREMRAAHES